MGTTKSFHNDLSSLPMKNFNNNISTNFKYSNSCISKTLNQNNPTSLSSNNNLKRTEILQIFSKENSLDKDFSYLLNKWIGQIVTVCGWSKSIRKQGAGKLCFVALSDGSTIHNLQVVVDSNIDNFQQLLKCGSGTSLCITGTISSNPKYTNSNLQENNKLLPCDILELTCSDNTIHNLHIYGTTPTYKNYPLAKKDHSREFLREIAHLRPRTNLISAVQRVRSKLAMATHTFFQNLNFVYIHTPIITALDCEGAGEVFQVTSLLPSSEQSSKSCSDNHFSNNLYDIPYKIVNHHSQIQKNHDDNMQKQVEITQSLSLNNDSTNKIIDYSKDFFGKPVYLTVSGQLAVENYCCALSNVYTFGPTFRAENSKTSRHLAEFWMVEPEMAFADIFDNMQCAQDYLKFCIQYALEHCYEDLLWLQEKNDPTLISRLYNIVNEDFALITYTDAIKILKKEYLSHVSNLSKQLDNNSNTDNKKKCGDDDNSSSTLSNDSTIEIYWGMDLSSELEKYLTDVVYKKPVIVYNYPKTLKSFYMRLNDENCEYESDDDNAATDSLPKKKRETVAAMDILLPKIGEIIGGSQREERLDYLDKQIEEKNLSKEAYSWYRELREFGSVPHSGFGLGFERLIMLVTACDNIRDVIPYPRYPLHADF